MRGKVLLYYAYVAIANPEREAERQTTLCQSLNLTGRIRVAKEGINGTVAGSVDSCSAYIDAMRKDEQYVDIDFKESDGDVGAFPDLQVRVTNEVVSLGAPEATVSRNGTHISPQEWHRRLTQAIYDGEYKVEKQAGAPESFLSSPPPISSCSSSLNTTSATTGITITTINEPSNSSACDNHGKVKFEADESSIAVIDMRNVYETAVGRFKGAVDPKTRQFSDLPAWIMANKETLRQKRTIFAYCTGGIRCEKATSLLINIGCDQVYQLKGGIHRYLEAFPDGGGLFSGKNFVFDGRREQGGEQGAVLGDGEIVGRCRQCENPWDRYDDRVRCAKCRVLLLVCDSCRGPHVRQEPTKTRSSEQERLQAENSTGFESGDHCADAESSSKHRSKKTSPSIDTLAMSVVESNAEPQLQHGLIDRKTADDKKQGICRNGGGRQVEGVFFCEEHAPPVSVSEAERKKEELQGELEQLLAGGRKSQRKRQQLRKQIAEIDLAIARLQVQL